MRAHLHLGSHIHPAAGTVGELAMQRPKSVKVLQKHGIDFCCGGGKQLADACAAAGIATESLLAEVSAAESAGPGDRRWDLAPLPELVDYILATHHVGLPEELDRLVAMAERVLTVHGAKDPERLAEIYELTLGLRAELLPHMHKEEQVLFPWIKQGIGAQAAAPIQVMEMEHEEVGDMLHRLHDLTEHYVAPEGACATWRALYQGLGDLDADLKQHIHLENNVLFPRVLAVG